MREVKRAIKRLTISRKKMRKLTRIVENAALATKIYGNDTILGLTALSTQEKNAFTYKSCDFDYFWKAWDEIARYRSWPRQYQSWPSDEYGL